MASNPRDTDPSHHRHEEPEVVRALQLAGFTAVKDLGEQAVQWRSVGVR